jgi:hypothetical protein
VAYTPGTQAGIEPTVRLDWDNELQPDPVRVGCGDLVIY